MLNAFGIEGGLLKALTVDDDSPGLERSLWIDMVDPSDEERLAVARLHRSDLPEVDDVEEIEASARYIEDEDGLRVHSLFLQDIEGRTVSTTVAFLVNADRLITLHEHDLAVFRLLRLRARRQRDLAENQTALLLGLFETKIENLADRLEEVHKELEAVSAMVLMEEESDLKEAVNDLTRQEDVNGKIRLCLMDTQRALTFLLRRARLEAEDREWVREMLRDVDSLLPHNAFLFEKVNFLLDAAIGFTNIRQAKIIKIFSIAAVVFLPPTTIASIYGMNFAIMPELSWTLGYPFALGLIVISGITPYLYFKYKGWL